MAAPSLTGTFEHEGTTVVLEKLPGRPLQYNGRGTREKGLRSVTVNGLLRGYIIIPHGWGKTPALYSLESFDKGDESYQARLYIGFMRGCSSISSYEINKIAGYIKDGKMPSRREVAKKRAEEQAEAAKWLDERKARHIYHAERRRKAIVGLEAILAERLSLTAEQTDGVCAALDILRAS
jgi:hypothetical protein